MDPRQDPPESKHTQPSMPESKPTLAIPKEDIVQAQLKQIIATLGTHRAETSDALGQLRLTLEKVVHEGIEVNTRMTRFEVRIENLEDRAATTSIKVKGASQVDLEHEAKQAEIIVKTQQLEEAIHETRAIAESTATEIAKQSDYMGMGKRGIAWATSKEGRASLFQLAVTAFGVWEVLKHGVSK